jgi:ammonium transporter, Amt family
LKRFVLAFAAVAVLLTLRSVAYADTPAPAPPPPPKLDSGDTAWMLVSTGLVLLMVPGLALFYAGMVRRKNVLGTMMHSMVALAIIGIQWVVFGYAFAFGKSQGGFIGWDVKYLGLSGVDPDQLYPGTNIPIFVHCMYQGMFAIITPALISGAIAERVRFGPYCLFIFLWGALVYVPLAHWVWAVDAEGNAAGWLGNIGQIIPAFKDMGALDFASASAIPNTPCTPTAWC